MSLEPPDQYITLKRAAELSGLTYETLKVQARGLKANPARLRVERLGPRTVLTTRRWLHEYLASRDARFKQTSPLPEGYVPPDAKVVLE